MKKNSACCQLKKLLMDNNNNLARQIEELEALNAIYADQWHVENQTDSYSIEITATVKLFITLHDNYPSLSAPTFELLAPTLSLEQKNRITNAFQTIHRWLDDTSLHKTITITIIIETMRVKRFCFNGSKSWRKLQPKKTNSNWPDHQLPVPIMLMIDSEQ